MTLPGGILGNGVLLPDAASRAELDSLLQRLDYLCPRTVLPNVAFVCVRSCRSPITGFYGGRAPGQKSNPQSDMISVRSKRNSGLPPLLNGAY